jgi:hypothetical protein
MGFRLGQYAKAFEWMYKDRCDIYRYFDETDPDDDTVTKVLSYEPIFRDIKCKISFYNNEFPNDKRDDDNPVEYNPMLFTRPDQDIIAGDFLVVRVMDDSGKIVLGTYKGDAGLPRIYVTHKQVLFAIDESA